MKLLTSEQSRKLDRDAAEIGLSGIVLMENAARNVASQLASFSSILIFCGKGNNGGDGFAAARHLQNQGKHVTVVLSCSETEIKGDAKINFDILKHMNTPILSWEDFPHDIPHDCAVDALLGTGIKGTVQGTISEMISYLNNDSAYILSIDIPSGLDASSGQICGTAVKADQTVTFQFAKKGMFSYPAKEYLGRLTVTDISIPDTVMRTIPITSYAITEEEVASRLNSLPVTSNKSDFGRVLNIAGSVGMCGAAELSTYAAVKSGGGLVSLACPASISEIEMSKLTEAMVLPVAEHDGMLCPDSVSQLKEPIETANAVAFGCGIGRSSEMEQVLSSVLSLNKPTVIDADALFALSGNLSLCEQKPVVLTPHPKEFSRLSGFSVAEIEQNRQEIAREFAKTHGVTLVLKGAATVVASPDGIIYLNTTGNQGMATGGSGDVLTGVIAALIASGLSCTDAAVIGVYLHGLAGDFAKEEIGMRGMTARDILNHLPQAFHSFE